MSGLLGKKLGMTNIFNDEGVRLVATAILVGPCKVVAVRTIEKNGYSALQLGFQEKKEKAFSKPEIGQFKKNNLPCFAFLREFSFPSPESFKVGDDLTASLFTEGESIKVRGISKGKGFQGVMKRHGFRGVGGTTHGQSDRLRAPGSIGSSSYPSRVFKGMKMAGRMGNDSITVANLKVIKVNAEQNVIFVKGCIPGSINSIVELYKK
ncbi:MAG: 50S ribosomal protein L3 [Ignavibacteriaceae bacterium]